MIKAGEVLVSMKAWFFAQEAGYKHFLKDHKSVKVTGFKDDLKGANHQQNAAFNFIEMRRQADQIDGLESASATLDALSPSIEAFGYGTAVDRSQNFSRMKSLQFPPLKIQRMPPFSSPQRVTRTKSQKVSPKIRRHSRPECHRTLRAYGSAHRNA